MIDREKVVTARMRLAIAVGTFKVVSLSMLGSVLVGRRREQHEHDREDAAECGHHPQAVAVVLDPQTEAMEPVVSIGESARWNGRAKVTGRRRRAIPWHPKSRPGTGCARSATEWPMSPPVKLGRPVPREFQQQERTR